MSSSDGRVTIQGYPDEMISRRIMELHNGLTPVVLWSQGPNLAFYLTRVECTLPAKSASPLVVLEFRQAGLADETAQIFDDQAAWVTSRNRVHS